MTVALWLLGCSSVVFLGLLLYLALRRNPLQPQVDGLRTREQTLVAEVAQLKTSLDHTEARRRDSIATAAEMEERSRALEKQRNSLEGDLRVARAEGDTLREVRDNLQRDLAALQGNVSESQQKLVKLTGENQGLSSRRETLEQQLLEQRKWVEDQTQRLEERVIAAAAKMMEERGKAFTELNKKEVLEVVAPFKAQLTDFRQRVDQIYDTENKERGELKQQILQLTSLNQSVSQEAQRLTNALTVTSKSTGNWGETILSRILEDSGLREGKEYRLQHSIAGQDGERLQPDAVIFLPGDRQLVVDSKVSNKAWTQYCAAESKEERKEYLKDHLLSLRAHVKGLSGKDYARSPDLSTVDFVLMFVPVEGALLTALAEDEALYTEAFQKKVILVTPSTLMAVVKLAEGLWTLQKRKESADEIAEAGRKLYEKLTNFADSFVDVGNAIEQSHRAYEKARGQLSNGRGNAISLAERMRDLGVSPGPGKEFPPELLPPPGDVE